MADTSNINLNLNQSPYFDDYDETKDFHQVLYKPSVAVQARELTQEQTILRNQLKRFGDHVFQNGSRVQGGEITIDNEYSFVKLQAQFNSVNITPSLFAGKTITGDRSGARATVVNNAAVDGSDPNTLWIKYISGGATTKKVQGIEVTNQGSGYTSAPTVAISAPPAGGTQATATAVLDSAQKVSHINITNAGDGYTSTPTVSITGGSGTDAQATATLISAAVFNDGELLSATDFSVQARAATSSATGFGSAASCLDGFYYFNGNFIRVAKQTIILDKYTNTPTYRIGMQVSATTVDSGEDSTLLDNATGAYNFAAPGADRLKYTLTFVKKTTASTDDTDFIEVIRLVDGDRHKEVKYAIYSELEQTFARRTNDESGSYTVRHFPLQLKPHQADTPDSTKLTARLDPGKAYIEGHEFRTFTSTDLTVDRARDWKQVNNFDRVMQYGNFTTVTNLEGLFNPATHAEVDLHKVASADLILTDPTTYASTKIGTARVRQQTWQSGNLTNSHYKLYLYSVTMSVGDFGDVNSIVIPEDPLSGTITLNAKCDIDTLGKSVKASSATVTGANVTAGGSGYTSAPTVTIAGGGGTLATATATVTGGAVTSVTITAAGAGYTSYPTISFSGGGGSGAAAGAIIGGDTALHDSDFNSLVFKLPQDTIRTIRDDSSNVDTSYKFQKVFTNVPIVAGQANLTSGGSSETFFGTGLLSSSVVEQNYFGIDSAGTIFDLNTSSPAQATVTVAGNSQSVNIFTGDATLATTASFICTMNVDNAQEKTKTLVKNKEVAIATPTTTSQAFSTLAISDVNKIHAIYDSTNSGSAASAPALTVSAATGTYLAGETITGGTSGAKGTIISHNPLTDITYVVTSGTFQASEVITGATNSYTATIGLVTAGSTNVTAQWKLDTGQRDNFYDHGRIQLTGTAPTGQLLVIMDYFSHAGEGYFSVDSYTATTTYDLIPSYISVVNGNKVELRDCIDFRPRRTDGTTAMEAGVQVPQPNTNWSADYNYYLARMDTLFVGKDKQFGVHKGVSADNPVPPYRLDGTMNLWQLQIPAYTFNPTDITAVYIENKRYTMKDIGKLEKRLNNVEYYTALTLLEKDAEALLIKDENGLDRFKNGILVDDFAGHSVGNVFNEDYKCAIDFQKRELRPPFFSDFTNIAYDSGASTGVQQTGDLITLAYTSTPFVTQTDATSFTSVNPFDVQEWQGVVALDPPNDLWVAKNNRPEVVVNATGENDAWESLAGLGFGSQWNDWQDIGTGRNERVVARGEAEWRGRALVQEQTFAVDQLQSRSGIRTEIVGSQTINQSLGERVVDLSVLPFIRAQNLTVSATGLKPNTRVYPFFDKTDVAIYCRPNATASPQGNLGDPIYTDDSGSISDLRFELPCPDFAQEQNPPLLVFRTGERQFLLTDDSNGNLENASTFGEAMFQAQGLLSTTEEVILSSRIPRLHVGGTGSAQEQIVTTRRFDRDVVIGWAAPPRRDPLAQTFFIDPNIYPDGIHLSDVDLYFKGKDPGNVPVNISIRATEVGFPSVLVAPFSDVSKLPSEINISDDASAVTNWVFPSPVYLAPGEYALVIDSNSNAYECFFAEMGENVLGSTRKVSKQPYIGVLFKSQNATTWQQEQNQDLTFKLNRCNFTTSGTHEAVFKNNNTVADFKMNVMQLTPQEIKVDNTAIDWSVKTTTFGGTLGSEYEGVVINKNHEFESQKVITTTSGSYLAKATLSSTNSSGHVSPVLDTGRMGVIGIENTINNLTTGEAEAPSGGDAVARYITRRVTLSDGFDASDLTVVLTANKPAGTDIHVYYKILSLYDSDRFDDKNWVAMNQSSNANTVSLDENDMVEYQYDPVNFHVNYTVGSATFTSFKTFAIKVVMTGNASTPHVPRILDLRAIAMA